MWTLELIFLWFWCRKLICWRRQGWDHYFEGKKVIAKLLGHKMSLLSGQLQACSYQLISIWLCFSPLVTSHHVTECRLSKNIVSLGKELIHRNAYIVAQILWASPGDPKAFPDLSCTWWSNFLCGLLYHHGGLLFWCLWEFVCCLSYRYVSLNRRIVNLSIPYRSASGSQFDILNYFLNLALLIRGQFA